MTLTRRAGLGVTLGVDPTGGTSFTVLGAIVEGIDGPDAKGEEYDASLLTDKYKHKDVAQVDPGDLTFTIAYDPADTATTQALALQLSGGTAGGSQTVAAMPNWQISYPIIGVETQQKETFLGRLKGFKRRIKKSEMIMADITIAVSGVPGYTGN